ncbi:head maturation protease [Xanthomonas phage NEB7]|nr:head maturation protease [Xanthomonas phage NEB7]
MPVATASYAFDKKSARSFDADGRMRVRDCVLSDADINPYYGREIPGWKELGLKPDTVYEMYRDPDALALAADSFNGLPLMIRHIAQTADEPRKEHTAGSVYNVRFEPPHLRGDLMIADGKAIEFVQSGMLADLSCSYRYKPEMTPGEVNGRRYDGRMMAIDGNHVALVEDGRATGAHVADSALSSQTGAPNVDPIENTPAPAAGNAELAQALMLLTEQLEALKADVAAIKGAPSDADKPVEGVPASVNTAHDEDPDNDKDKDDKPVAMDAASVQAVVDAAVTSERARAKAVEQAKRDCRPDLGDMIAMDNANDIYREALKQRGVDVSAIPAGAEMATYQAIQSVTRGSRLDVTVSRANDSASGAPAFDTSRIRNLGR